MIIRGEGSNEGIWKHTSIPSYLWWIADTCGGLQKCSEENSSNTWPSLVVQGRNKSIIQSQKKKTKRSKQQARNFLFITTARRKDIDCNDFDTLMYVHFIGRKARSHDIFLAESNHKLDFFHS